MCRLLLFLAYVIRSHPLSSQHFTWCLPFALWDARERAATPLSLDARATDCFVASTRAHRAHRPYSVSSEEMAANGIHTKMLLNNACQSNNWGAPIYQDVTVDNGSIHNRSWTSAVSGMINTINFGRKNSLLDPGFQLEANGDTFQGEGHLRWRLRTLLLRKRCRLLGFYTHDWRLLETIAELRSLRLLCMLSPVAIFCPSCIKLVDLAELRVLRL